MRTLAAIMARAQMAVDTDLAGPSGAGRAGAGRACAAGIDDPFGMLFGAAKRNGQTPVLGFNGIDRTLGGAADGKETLPVRQFDALRQDHTRGAEGRMDIPDRAGTAMFGNGKRGGVKALCDIAGLVDPQKEKGNAPPPVTLQCGQALGGLFQRNRKGGGQPVKIIAGLFRSAEEGLIGHQQCGGEVICQFHLAAGGV